MSELAVDVMGRVNISLSEPAGAAMAYIAQKFPFKENMALTQLGLAYAIRMELGPVRDAAFAKPASVQNMNLGSFDPNNEIRNLLKVLYPDQGDPAIIAETLMNVGLLKLEADIKSGAVTRLSHLVFDEGDAEA